MGVIDFKGLSFAYKAEAGLILDNINLDFEEEKFICILGKSGCGKSTMLRLMMGLEKPTAGEILFHGEPINDAGLDRGVVFQDYGLFPWMSAGKNILLALQQRFPEMSKIQLKETALEKLRDVGLDKEIFNKLPKELSGGMKQRCAIAQAFAIDPPVLLMDEPFGALDAVTRAYLQDLLINLWSKGVHKKTIFFVTHDVDEALLLANRIIVLGQKPSTVIFDYTIPEEMKPTRETQFVDPHIVGLRNELIKQINSDVTVRIS